TTGPSPRSIATSPTPCLPRNLTRARSPGAVCSMVLRAISSPRSLTTLTAWSWLAQSTPAVTPLTGWSGSLLLPVVLADFTSASSLLDPVGRHPLLGAGTHLSVSSLIGAPSQPSGRPWRTALSTITASRVTAGPCRTHRGPQGVERAGQ